jgi:uncharacterized damage-inducible protein DinB
VIFAMVNLREMIEEYVAGPCILRRAVTGLNREQLLARPVPGKWSTLEVLCHLADFEPIMADRMKRVIALDNPSFTGADESRFAAALAYHERDLEEELTIIEQTSRQMSRILLVLQGAALQRVGIHNEGGPRTLEQLLAGAIEHLAHHVKFISEKVRLLEPTKYS